MIKSDTKIAFNCLINNPTVKKFLEESYPEYEFVLDSTSYGLRLELTRKIGLTVTKSLFLGKTNKEAQGTLEKLHEFLWILQS